ncbi:uncharacterized protein Z518_01214 [Rhinocladiella mackenziei CBS 650.93]|uniref:N-acetyl-D-glucosamine kinase n=1 Tax=Rhinocladiella mackenziei CBS 650.93 TaxID=1442369 RepID=A0A0D2HHJ6_9EURO|nr:uncharacterized protein Z518_01214 [Rhinocladiella mackenziei CBS 650.93]KIX10133.1 hypothetical protein Z518_01214 [Rhinocladiella mackenziei CBS 650.93]
MSASVDLAGLQTERRNPNSVDIDQISTVELCQIINREDATIAKAGSKCVPVIATAIDVLAALLGVLDASEIPPAYSAPEGQFVGLIAGGDDALRHAQEGAEDDVDAAVRDLEALELDGKVDSLVGIASHALCPELHIMVDLKATNLKLQQRSRNILRSICGSSCPSSDSELDDRLKSCGRSTKLAIAALSLGVPVSEAKQRLAEAGGVLATVLTKPVSDMTADSVLCIDGGGSKCAAVIMSPDGTKGYGEAGGCNVTDVGVEAAILSISLAIQRASDSHPILRGEIWRPHLFSPIWAALAGHDRKDIATSFDKSLENMFKRPLGAKLKVANDIELLATSAAEKHTLGSAVVLVAGTGSVAMSYTREPAGLVRTGRSGGWGHPLGDDGSSFDTGRQGVRFALRALDEFNHRQNGVAEATIQAPLAQRILKHFRPKGTDTLDFDLLSAVLASSSDQEKKRLIAEAAQIVIEASPEDTEAKAIVRNAVCSLVSTLDPIISSPRFDPAMSILVLAGGLMQSSIFGQTVKN